MSYKPHKILLQSLYSAALEQARRITALEARRITAIEDSRRKSQELMRDVKRTLEDD